MLPEDIALAVLATAGVGVLTALASLALIFRWNLIHYEFSPWTRKRAIGIYIAFIGYILTHSIVLSVLVLGTQFPTLVLDILLLVLFYSIPFILLLSICTIPLIWICQPESSN